MINSGLDVTSL